MSITENLARIQTEIADACARAHRSPSDVALMAVSKVHPVEALIEAHAAGQRLFGENRVQEWQSKSEAASQLKDLEIHLIGPLQSNKSTKAAELFHAIDTIDSLKIAQRLNTAAVLLGKHIPIHIEIKLSPEDTKHGLPPEGLPTLLASLAPFKHLTPIGLMTVPPWSEDPETARPYFQALRRLRDENLPQAPTLTGLSMGMSGDFAVAIQEGSTTIRIGTAIFGKRTYPPVA
jgi:pyridoxal phosphate enzyme (YggS family)